MMSLDQRVGGARTALSARSRLRGQARTWLSALLCAGLATSAVSAADSPSFRFQTNDIIAFVGGEDVVEMQRNGYLELSLTADLPHHKLRFRNLAFEGDTVFEQHRQLNFPSWEKQLERVGATVVIAQFGQAESLQGTNGLGRFVEAYERLLNRFTNGGRRLVLLSPSPIKATSGLQTDYKMRLGHLKLYTENISRLAQRRQDPFVDWIEYFLKLASLGVEWSRDGLHLNTDGHKVAATAVVQELLFRLQNLGELLDPDPSIELGSEQERLRQLILEKNCLWFDYWRPQNWAFLHGDRTEQPSSRDHRDLKKRWFPAEMEKFLPLIETKEKEIWKLAAELK